MKLTKRILLKFLIIAVIIFILEVILLKFICIPGRIRGISMEPTYMEGQFNFCWRSTFLLSKPRRFDVVMARFPDIEVEFFKRIVAFENETVEFKDGNLFLNGKEIKENYIKYPCNWNIKATTVAKEKVFIVGDNRSMPIQDHMFGETNILNIVGIPLF